MTSWRRLGVTGLKVLSAMSCPTRLQTGRDVDAAALGEGDHCLLEVGLLAAPAAERLTLALAQKRVHRLDLDVEQSFDRRFDLRLRRVSADLENHLVFFRRVGRLL